MLFGRYTSKITGEAFSIYLIPEAVSALNASFRGKQEIAANLTVMMTKKKRAVAGHDCSDMSTQLTGQSLDLC